MLKHVLWILHNTIISPLSFPQVSAALNVRHRLSIHNVFSKNSKFINDRLKKR